MALVGFFDILGTRDAVMADRFGYTDSREFINAIGCAAEFSPSIRFAVFSDSLVFSAETEDVGAVLTAVSFMYGNWLSEMVNVRGAISCGDIHWPSSYDDESFDKLDNFTYTRVFGKGLVTAYELEQRSGPGSICFLTGTAADVIRAHEPRSVLDGHTAMLCWATEREARGFDGYAKDHLSRSKKDSAEWRHAYAVQHYWSQVLTNNKFLLDKP